MRAILPFCLQVAIGYQQLGDTFIQDLPISAVQDSGLLFMWVINAKYRFALTLLDKWGYKYEGETAVWCSHWHVLLCCPLDLQAC